MEQPFTPRLMGQSSSRGKQESQGPAGGLGLMLVEEGLGLAGVGSSGAQGWSIMALTCEGRLPPRGAYRQSRRGTLTVEGGC